MVGGASTAVGDISHSRLYSHYLSFSFLPSIDVQTYMLTQIAIIINVSTKEWAWSGRVENVFTIE